MEIKSIFVINLIYSCTVTAVLSLTGDSMLIDLITTANVTIEWDDFPILTCAMPTSANVSLLTCMSPSNNIDFNETTCFQETTTVSDFTTLSTDQTSTSRNDITTSAIAVEETSTVNSDTTTFLLVATTVTEMSTSLSDSTMRTTEGATSFTTTVQLTSTVTAITYTCADGSLGQYCNISSNVCDMSDPCLNGAYCYPNNTSSLGYTCGCLSGFSGYNCESDNRVCQDNTCWHNGTCMEVNTTVSGSNMTTFQCQCLTGYDGTNCELEDDMCANITCQNMGICLSSYLSWSCQCLDSSLYSGVYCEDESSALVIKQAVSKSLAIIAIIALSLVCGFVVFMDILKYVFKIDPIDRERLRLKMEQEKKEKKRRRPIKKKKKVKKRKVSLRFSVV